MVSSLYDIVYLRAGVDVLERYLLSRDLYWPIGANPPAGEPVYPRLTLSGLLLARARLRSRLLSQERRSEHEDLHAQMDAIHSRWRVAWEKKASREYHSRLNLWRDFLEEYRASQQNNSDRYAYEVSRRVMLHMLEPDAAGVPQVELDMLKGLDRILRAVLLPGGFVWEPELEQGFPTDPFWYLYGQLKS